MKSKIQNQKHTWIVTIGAISLAVLLLLLIPKKEGYSLFFFGLAGGHLLLALLAIFSGWIVIPQKFFNKIFKRKLTGGFDFGYSPKWIYSFAVASALVFLTAIFVYFSFGGSPILKFLLFTFLLLLAVNLFIGFVIFQNSKKQSQLTLPFVSLLPGGKGKVLDAGCGAGRTTIAIAKVYPEINIVSFDKFNAEYIEDGGSELFRKNISFAEISGRVEAKQGDITATPFADNQFDAIVSSFMFDHLGKNKQKALNESYRILKPDGRFLLIIAVRSFAMFGIANFFSLLFSSRSQWKRYMKQAGFKVISEGIINEASYFLIEK